MIERRVVISGMGVVSPFGIGQDIFLTGLREGKSAAQLITSFDVSRLPTRFAAPVPLNDKELESHLEVKKPLKTMSRASVFAQIAAHEAVASSGLDTTNIDPYRFATSLGTGGLGLADIDHVHTLTRIIEMTIERTNGHAHLDQGTFFYNKLREVNPLTRLKALPNIATAHLAIAFNARGNCLTISTACTSGAQAIGEAYRQIKADIADVCLTGGSDAMVNPDGLVAFSALGVLSRNNDEYQTASRPFDKQRDGFVLGEGAALFVIEEMAHCQERGGVPLAEIVGYASTSDAFRLTDEPPEAWGSIRAMQNALKSAALHPSDIDYINAHGTGTRMNDKTETFAIKQVFRAHAYDMPVSSTKSMIGHLVAAAGAVELAATLSGMLANFLPPTINYRESDEDCDLDYVPNEAREAHLKTVLSNSFGFGGQNACLILKKVEPSAVIQPNESGEQSS